MQIICKGIHIDTTLMGKQTTDSPFLAFFTVISNIGYIETL
jgi:hypothetical protein